MQRRWRYENVPERRSAAPRRVVGATLAYATLTLIAILFLVPFLWLLIASITPNATLAVDFPKHPTLSNFSTVLTKGDTVRPLLNEILISGGTGLLTMFAAALAAYPLSRYNLRFKKPFMYSILFGTGLPVTAILVPVYALFVQLNLVDSMVGTMFFMSATSLPFAIWLMKNFMDSVQVELEEAAWVDGATAMQSLRLVVLPLMVPGFSVVGIFTFILAWGNFFSPFILLLSQNKLPAAVTIYQFFGQGGMVAYGQLAAYSILYSVPVVVLYIFISRFLGGAFNLGGAVKG